MMLILRRRGFNQKAVAALLDITEATMSRRVNGAVPIDQEAALALRLLVESHLYAGALR